MAHINASSCIEGWSRSSDLVFGLYGEIDPSVTCSFHGPTLVLLDQVLAVCHALLVLVGLLMARAQQLASNCDPKLVWSTRMATIGLLSAFLYCTIRGWGPRDKFLLGKSHVASLLTTVSVTSFWIAVRLFLSIFANWVRTKSAVQLRESQHQGFSQFKFRTLKSRSTTMFRSVGWNRLVIPASPTSSADSSSLTSPVSAPTISSMRITSSAPKEGGDMTRQSEPVSMFESQRSSSWALSQDFPGMLERTQNGGRMRLMFWAFDAIISLNTLHNLLNTIGPAYSISARSLIIIFEILLVTVADILIFTTMGWFVVELKCAETAEVRLKGLAHSRKNTFQVAVAMTAAATSPVASALRGLRKRLQAFQVLVGLCFVPVYIFPPVMYLLRGFDVLIGFFPTGILYCSIAIYALYFSFFWPKANQKQGNSAATCSKKWNKSVMIEKWSSHKITSGNLISIKLGAHRKIKPALIEETGNKVATVAKTCSEGCH